MDCVILAAGKGSRLDGITAPYLKPLLVMNGKPLISQAVDAAYDAGCERVIIVVAPENALPISQVLGDRKVSMTVQRVPQGPGAALRIGLELVRTDEVLILMGDNFFGERDVNHVAMVSGNAVGTELVHPDMAERLTWERDGEWVEKTPAQGNKQILAWVGPLKLNTGEILDAIDGWNIPGEVPIGPLLNDIITPIIAVGVHTIDVGVPEALA